MISLQTADKLDPLMEVMNLQYQQCRPSLCLAQKVVVFFLEYFLKYKLNNENHPKVSTKPFSRLKKRNEENCSKDNGHNNINNSYLIKSTSIFLTNHR